MAFTREFLTGRSRVAGGLRTLAWRTWVVGAGLNYRIDENGERRLLESLSGAGIREVLDIGAHVGQWTQAALDNLAGARVHAFEPSPDNFAHLSARFCGVSRASCWQEAMGSSPGNLRLVQAGSRGSHTHVDHLDHATVDSASFDAPMTTVDEFLAQSGMAHVDLVKIDVEGFEGEVLAGMARTLKTSPPAAIQFEFTPLWLDYSVTLAEVYRSLADLGYAVGRLTSRGIDFAPYSPRPELFVGPNFVAVHRDGIARFLIGGGARG